MTEKIHFIHSIHNNTTRVMSRHAAVLTGPAPMEGRVCVQWPHCILVSSLNLQGSIRRLGS